MDMIKQLVKHGKVIRPYLGIKIATLSPFLLQQIEKNNDIPDLSKGILVTEVLSSNSRFLYSK
jgi:S1-C subfamily serine protease